MTTLFRCLSVLGSLLTAFLLPCAVLAAEGQFISETLHSKALENNLLGDSPDRSVLVYLPPSYDSSPDRRYPVVYLLHGYLMDNASWTGGTFGSLFDIRKAVDHFMAEHPDREMVLVMPDGHNKYLGSWYVNSPVTGNWEDFIVQELVQHIDSTYRTLPQTAHRGLAGYSMGGSGAWILVERYPEVYGAVYSLSGGVAPHDLLKDELMWRKVLAVENMDQFDSLSNYIYQAQVSLAAAFSPNPDKPPFFVDFPVELVGGELRVVEPIWQKWLANLDLPAMMYTYQAQLRQLQAIRFGLGDLEPEGFSEHLATAQALSELGIPYVYEKYAGWHTYAIPSKIETYVLPFFAQVLYGYYPAVRQATDNLGSTLAGQPLTAGLLFELAGPLEATGTFPQVSLELSPLGLEERPFLHDGQGRYTFDGTIIPPRNGRFRLPVYLHSEGEVPYLFYEVALDVYPAEEQTLFTDGLASGWQATTSNNVTFDPQATAQVFAGNTSLGVQASSNSFALRFLPPEPVEGFGYTLRFALHPGKATGGSLPSFKLALRGKDVLTAVTKKLNGVNVDLEKKEWQVVEVPLQEMFLGEPVRTIELLGTLKGTFYLDDIRLVPQASPQPTAVEEERTAALPQSFSLAQNYPNPFNSGTMVWFSLSQSADLDLAVYNLAGQKVATLVNGRREAGAYTVHWDGKNDSQQELASGIYLYRLEAGPQVETRKLLLLR